MARGQKPKSQDVELTKEQWDMVARCMAGGQSWSQAGYKVGVQAKVLQRAGELRGLFKGKKPQVQFIGMSAESGHFLQGGPDVIKYAPDDPEQVLIGVRNKLTIVASGIEKKILEPETLDNLTDFHAAGNPVTKFALEARQEGFGVREYVSILKDIAKLAQAHMPYRHATLSAIAIKDMDKSNGLTVMTREEKRKRLTTLLEQSGMLDQK